MTKVVYESIVIIFTSSIIFACTLSAVLIILLRPSSQMMGIDNRVIIVICVLNVIVFSVGLVGTIAESFRALNIYSCLVIIFPFGLLLIQMTVRISKKPFDTIDKLLVLGLIILLMQIVVAYLLAREIRRLTILNRGINYKMCHLEDGSDVQLCEAVQHQQQQQLYEIEDRHMDRLEIER